MPVDAVEAYARSFYDGIAPTQALTVSEWADEFRYLSTRSSAEPGRWRTTRTPYLREIMDSLSASSEVETVIFISGSQVGKTECMNNWLGYTIDHDPCPMLIVSPTVDLAKRLSRQKVEPMIEDCPAIRSKIREARSRDSGNTMLSKEFPGGMIVMTGANSAAGLRQMAARKIALDEVDAYGPNVEGEGDPVELARARARTFTRRKYYFNSTPTFTGRSRIQAWYDKSDQRRYQLPCPHCAHYQTLVWTGLRWDKGDPRSAVYRCVACERTIEERYKTVMLEAGRWVPEHPECTLNLRGYHLSSLYSPLGWLSWEEIAAQWEEAQGKPDLLRVFVNTVLGETYLEKGEAPPWEDLYQRREDYPMGKVPPGGLVLTAGVDVQAKRLECEVVAWGRGMESWSIEYVVVPGDTSDEETWKGLEPVLERQYEHLGGKTSQVRMMAVDSGYNTTNVYGWVRKQHHRRVIAVKGRGNYPTVVGQPAVVDVTVSGRRLRRGVQVWPVGVGIIKSELYGWLRLRPPLDPVHVHPHGYCHFPMYGEEYFRQLTAEQLMTRRVKGYIRTEWENVRPGGRNEAIDCRTYARAAAEVLGLHRWDAARWTILEGALAVARSRVPGEDLASARSSPAAPDPPAPARPRRRGSFWEGRRRDQ
jgi:phage terminase large subunit GpA-like protein